jgi:hypothetical protein
MASEPIFCPQPVARPDTSGAQPWHAGQVAAQPHQWRGAELRAPQQGGDHGESVLWQWGSGHSSERPSGGGVLRAVEDAGEVVVPVTGNELPMDLKPLIELGKR